MNKIRQLIFVSIILFLCSCSSVKNGFSNQKKNSTDEFLIEKKTSLVIPPNYSELPKPELEKIDEDSKENKIKDLISSDEKIDTIIVKENGQNLEDSLLKKIKKN